MVVHIAKNSIAMLQAGTPVPHGKISLAKCSTTKFCWTHMAFFNVDRMNPL